MLVKVFLESNPSTNEILTQCIDKNGEIRYYYAEFGIGQTDFFGVSISPDDYTDEDGERMFSGAADFDKFAEHFAKLLNENQNFVDFFTDINDFGTEAEQFRNMELEEIDRELNYNNEGLPKFCDPVEWYLIREFETDEEF